MANYTTAQKVANLLGICSTLIKPDWIVWADSQVESRLGKTYSEVTVVEEPYDGTDTDILVLDKSPITSVTKVEYLQDYTPLPVWYELIPTYWRLYAPAGYIRLIPDLTGTLIEIGCFEEGVQNWRVSYKYGYAIVPKLVELLATLMVAEMYNISTTGVSGSVTSETIGSYSVSFGSHSSETIGISPLIERVTAMILGGNGQVSALGL